MPKKAVGDGQKDQPLSKKSKHSSLPEAFAGWPTSTKDKYHLQFIDAKTDKLSCYFHFSTAYAAKKFILIVIGASDTEMDYKDLIIGDKIVVHGPVVDVRQIMEHEFTTDEKAWNMPEPYATYAAMIAGRRTNLQKKLEEEKAIPPRPDVKVLPRSKRPPGLVTIQDICAELNVLPAVARNTLRKKGVPKTIHGYAWTPDEADKIRKILK